MATLRIEQVF